VKLIETLKLALSAIWAHKLRSVLTLLGMIIGVTAVVVVVSVIQGFNAYFDEKIAGIGSKSFSIRRFAFEDFKDTDTIAAAQRRNKDLTLDELEYLRARSTYIGKLGAKALATRRQVKRGSEILEEVPVDGATPIIADIDNLDIAEGRFFSEAEAEAAMRVAYIGADIANKLFQPGRAIGEELVIQGLPYRVVGVATAKGTVFGQPQDTFITIPLKTYEKSFGPLVNQRALYMVATSKTDQTFNDAVEEPVFCCARAATSGPTRRTTSASSRRTRSQASATASSAQSRSWRWPCPPSRSSSAA
jgi:putative ABC transport system permease protein